MAVLLPKAWIQDRKRDYYYKKAKAENYRSRATYKLSQAAAKYHFIRKDNVVVDLGAAPGGWIQAARKIVGKKGFVLGVDLKPIAPFPQEYVRTIVADINEPETPQQILDFLPRKADVVISDASPNIAGVWEVDHARQIDLAAQALKIALSVLRPSGNFFVKVFEGDMLADFVKTVEKHFVTVKILKPKASRAKSSEMFLLAMNLKSAEQSLA
ncbi:MAG: RlmE family RNA methyltransferase [Crenarchaeota archaeon]|nr:RlmE family RNA methyltransferase [Thermoproteota archaeon]